MLLWVCILRGRGFCQIDGINHDKSPSVDGVSHQRTCRLTSRKAFLKGTQVCGLRKQTWTQTWRSLTREECLLLTKRWVTDGPQSCGYILVRLMGGAVLIEAQFLVHGRLMKCRPSWGTPVHPSHITPPMAERFPSCHGLWCLTLASIHPLIASPRQGYSQAWTASGSTTFILLSGILHSIEPCKHCMPGFSDVALPCHYSCHAPMSPVPGLPRAVRPGRHGVYTCPHWG